MKTRYLALLGALALTLSIVTPALGGPSIGSVAKTAKKALRLAKTANRKANFIASHYQPVQTVQVGQTNVPAAPLDFARFTVTCPSGYAPTGFGPGYGALDAVAFFPTSSGYIGSMFNPSDTTVYSGDLYVVCVYGDYSSTAKVSALSRDAARAKLRAAERAVRRANVRD